jgi:hypothetical protein
MHYHDSNGRKRTAENALDEPTSLEPPSHRRQTPPTTQAPSSMAPPASYDSQPRKVIAPGATQAAIARLSALKAQNEKAGTPPLKAPSSKPVTTAAAAVSPRSQQQQRSNTKGVSPAVMKPTAAPSGTKVLAPGATQAALSRLKGNHSTAPINPPKAPPAAAVHHHQHPSGPSTEGPRKVITPGATQAALARLASLKSAGGHHHASLPPPTHPLFQTNGTSGGGGGGGSTVLPSSVPFTATAADYTNGTVVWAKMQSYPWWPAQVQEPNQDQMRLRHTSQDIFIVFYGTADYSWLPLSELKLFRANLPEYSKFAAPRNKSLQRAIDQAWVSVGQPRPDVMGKMAKAPAGGAVGSLGGQQHHYNHHNQGW